MKYLINLLFLLGAAFFLGGCSDNGDPVDTPRLEVSESSLRFGSPACPLTGSTDNQSGIFAIFQASLEVT